jgi:hypothetical protein
MTGRVSMWRQRPDGAQLSRGGGWLHRTCRSPWVPFSPGATMCETAGIPARVTFPRPVGGPERRGGCQLGPLRRFRVCPHGSQREWGLSALPARRGDVSAVGWTGQHRHRGPDPSHSDARSSGDDRYRGSLVTLTRPGGHRRITPSRPGSTLGDVAGGSKSP